MRGGYRMKTIGLIGGMSWESTVTYYQIIEACQSSGDWEKCGDILAEAAQRLEQAGADFIVICTNTMHKVAPQVQDAVSIPLLHIAEATAQELKKSHIDKVGLLGTIYTMEQDFYKAKLQEAGIEVLIPEEEDRQRVNYIIFQELCLGVLDDNSRQTLLAVIDKLAQQGAQGIVLGCTEIGLLVQQQDTDLPLFDTALIHAQKAALYSLDG